MDNVKAVEMLLPTSFFQITHPGKDLPELLAASIHAISNVLSYDGLSGINAPLESVEYLTSMVRETDIGEPGNDRNNGPVRNSNNFLRSLLDSRDYSQNHNRAEMGRFKHHVYHTSNSAPQNHKSEMRFKHHAHHTSSLAQHNQRESHASQGNASNAPRGDSHKRNRGNRG